MAPSVTAGWRPTRTCLDLTPLLMQTWPLALTPMEWSQPPLEEVGVEDLVLTVKDLVVVVLENELNVI